MTGTNRVDPVANGTGHDADIPADTGNAPTAEVGKASRVRCLVVGDMAPPQPSANDDTAVDITCLPFVEVTPEALALIRPDVVFSSLVGPGFDCLDLAERLVAAGFRGQYRAAAPTVPDPNLVRREITDRFPTLDFDLVILEDHATRAGTGSVRARPPSTPNPGKT